MVEKKRVGFPGSMHNHTHYSNLKLRDCILRETELIDLAIKLGHKAVAITDHDTVSSAMKVEKYYNKIKQDHPDFKVIQGNEIYLCRDGLNSENYVPKQDRYYHFVLLAKNAEGHKQIRELSTRAWGRSYMSRGQRRVPTYYSDIFEIIGKNPGNVIGSTACFRAGTSIETKNGWKNIEDLTSDDKVKNRYGEWEKVNCPTSRDYQGVGFEIVLSGNERPIVCTANHQFLVITSNKKNPQWVAAEDLIMTRGGTKHIGLSPVSPLSSDSEKGIIKKVEFLYSWSEPSVYSHKKIILPDEIVITPELMRLFGLFLGDGYITLKSRPRIGFTFNIKEFEVFEKSFFKEAMNQLNVPYNPTVRKENNRVDVSIDSVELVDLFYYLFGDVKASTKKIPSRLRINKEFDIELVFGYMLADGYFRLRTPTKIVDHQTGEFVTASISKQLSYDIFYLLDSLGLAPSISLSKGRTDKDGVTHQDSWYVQGSNKILGTINKIQEYSHSEIVTIFEEAIQYKASDYITFDNTKYRKIRFKKRNQIQMDERVYCLNNDTHSFKVENVIVHNCLGGALGTQLLKYRETQDEKLYQAIKGWTKQLSGVFGENHFYLELQPSATSEQTYVNRELIKLADELNLPYIITTDSHYGTKADRPIHKAFLNSQGGDREVDSFYATTYMMETEELESYLDLTEEELQTAYGNIEKIISMCEDFSLKKDLVIPKLMWKTFEDKVEKYANKVPLLKEFYEDSYIGNRELAKALSAALDADERTQNEEHYAELGECLRMIKISSKKNNAHWSDYLLNLQRIIDEIWNAGSLVGCGRGSGVGFLPLYLLGITQINPLWENTKTFNWRFLNPERVSPLDIDLDSEGSKRGEILSHLRKVYGYDRVSNVATFGTEKSKSAIATAVRGLGYDVDLAQYLSSMISVERGEVRTLKETYYGDEEKGIARNHHFVEEINKYPEVWKVAQRIEGLINRLGAHAGGVIFVDEPFINSTALMKTPSGETVTQFELHDSEDQSLIKYDILSVKGLDKIHNCIDLLIKDGLIDPEPTLKATYEKIVGIYNLEREAPEMWEMVHNQQIRSLFQMEQQSGIQGIALTKPTNVDELAVLNSVIRLMNTEKGGEQPLDKFKRFKTDINEWYREMSDNGLSEDEMKLLEPVLLTSSGICESQEKSNIGL